MLRWLILISIFGFTAAQIIAYRSFGTCSYTGDPHLRPFPTAPGNISNMYLCKHIGWDILLRNRWVLIIVRVGPFPWVILNHIVIFFKADGSIACLLIGSLGISTCPISSSVTTITSLSGTSWTHYYNPVVGQYLSVQISSFLWGIGTRYDFNIRQTFNLIRQSSGLCVKHDCELERILTHPPIIIKICDRYITGAQQRLRNPVDPATVGFIRASCENDLVNSFVPKLGQTALVDLILRDLDKTNTQEYPDAVMKAYANIQEATAAADRDIAGILAQGDKCFEQQFCLINDDG